MIGTASIPARWGRETVATRVEAHRDLLWVLAWALGLRLLFLLLTADTYDPDEFVVLALGKDFARGAVPYRDFMFFHPPGVLVLFRCLQPITAWWWPLGRVTMVLIDACTAVLVWRVGTILYGRRAALAAGLIYGASPLALVCSVRVGQDPIITALGMSGLLILLSTRSHRGGLLAGACLGLAVWTKYPALLFAPVYLIVAPRRAAAIFVSFGAVLLILFAPFLHVAHALFDQTVVWQVSHRRPASVLQRIGSVGAFWLLLNPLAVVALRGRRAPAWLVAGFAVGGVFLLASQTYYHYFVPIVPFAALLAAPLLIQIVGQQGRLLAVSTITLVTLWAIDISFGSDPTRLFITASRLSTANLTAKVLDETTRPGERVLTDQMEYAYLAQRQPVADYFWNMSDVIGASFLEKRLKGARAVVLTERVAPTYPPGFTRYLHNRYLEISTGTTEVWLIGRRSVAESVSWATPSCAPADPFGFPMGGRVFGCSGGPALGLLR